MAVAVLGPREVGRRLVAKRRQLAEPPSTAIPVLRPSRPRQHGSDLLGVAQQVFDPGRRGEARLQERLVRRVFEQPPHQVGHARQDGAIGRIDPHAMAAVDQGALDQVAHAEERLELVGRLGQSPRLGGGDRVGQAADVVAAERRPQLVVMLDQEPRAPLERRVALPFLQVDRLGPAQPPRGRDLVVPVRSLDQPDRDRRPAALDPVAEHPQLVLGIARGRPARRSRRRASRGTRAPRAPGRTARRSGPGRRIAPCRHGYRPPAREPRGGSAAAGRLTRSIVASAWIGSNWAVRLDSLSERLTRGIGPCWSRSIRGIFGGGSERAGQPADQGQAGLLVHVGLGLADDRLAEQVGREGQPAAAEGQDGLSGLVGRGSGDELSGHHAGRRPRRLGQPFRPCRARGRQPRPRLEPPGDAVAGLGQILRQVPADRVGRS